MIKGLDHFRQHFSDYQNNYILIGGVACHLAMEDADLIFRATKDLDIVLCAEAIDPAFAKRLWAFIKDGGYEHQEKSTGNKQFYRFSNPTNPVFPDMLEIFSRKPDQIQLVGESHLTPIPVEEEGIPSLSAILLDEDYYDCIEMGRFVIDGLPILNPEYILPFKARAWLDLKARRDAGESVDSKNIKKHRNDFFRLFVLLSPASKVKLPSAVQIDMQQFIAAMQVEDGLDIKSLGLQNASLLDVFENLTAIYGLEQ